MTLISGTTENCRLRTRDSLMIACHSRPLLPNPLSAEHRARAIRFYCPSSRSERLVRWRQRETTKQNILSLFQSWRRVKPCDLSTAIIFGARDRAHAVPCTFQLRKFSKRRYDIGQTELEQSPHGGLSHSVLPHLSHTH